MKISRFLIMFVNIGIYMNTESDSSDIETSSADSSVQKVKVKKYKTKKL